MTILITGVAGFIGSHTAEFFLKKGDQVIGLDNFDDFYDKQTKILNLEHAKSFTNFSFIEGSILDKRLLEKIVSSSGIDLVIHLAAKAGVRPSIINPTLYQTVNLDGTSNVLEAMKKNPSTKLIFASSSSVYGETNKVPFKEDDILSKPLSPYAATKIEGEYICKHFCELHDLKYTILRFFSVYGPRQRPDMGISKFFKQLICQQPVTLYGDGTSRRDYTYVDDIVQGISLSAHLPSDGEIINLGNSEPITLQKLISSMEEVVGKKALIEYQDPKEGDVTQTYASIELAKQLLGYTPTTNLLKGLRKQFEFLNIRNNA